MIHKGKIETILDESLSRVLDDKESLDTVVEDYSEWGNELKDPIKTAQWLAGQRQILEPRPGFISSTQQYLSSEIILTKLHRQFRFMPFRREGYIRRLVTVLLICLVTLFGGAALILTSEDSLPGDALYQVKIVTEDIWVALPLQPSKQARLHLQFAQEHLIACAILASQGRYKDAENALQHYERHMAGAGRLVPFISDFGPNEEMFSIDFSQRYLQDIETIRILLPGEF
jgi:hypothetical protein